MCIYMYMYTCTRICLGISGPLRCWPAGNAITSRPLRTMPDVRSLGFNLTCQWLVIVVATLILPLILPLPWPFAALDISKQRRRDPALKDIGMVSEPDCL